MTNNNTRSAAVDGLIEEGEAFDRVVALGRGRQSLDRSVWYSGWLLTFLATGKETRGGDAGAKRDLDRIELSSSCRTKLNISV